jgi:RHS repeat-associated protein
VDCRTNDSGGSAVAETYSYDAADRLTLGTVATTGAACGGTTASTESYGLNNADFISSKSGESTASNNWAATNPGSVNAIGTLTPSGGTGLTYSYDANGNVLSDGTRNYTWDAENRLLTITEIATGHVSTFAYDGLGRRTAITESGGGGTTGYLWCGQTLCSSYNSSGATLDRFLPWGEVDSGTSYYYERDHLGTVVSTTNTSGTTEATLTTDAYGYTLSSSLTSGASAPNFGYAGMFSHSPSGLYLTRNRAYDPFSGRWLSRDPAGEQSGGSTDLYTYVGNDSINKVDQSGLQEEDAEPGDNNLDPGADLTQDTPFGSPEDPQYTPPTASGNTGLSCPVRLHSEQTIMSSNQSGYNYWSKQTSQAIIDSLAPGQPEPLTVNQNGTIVQGNTRILILEQRGFPTGSLPQTPYP